MSHLKKLNSNRAPLKIIISHDVDHLHGTEHWRDHYWPGVWWRSSKSLFRCKINSNTWLNRCWPFQRLERVREVTAIDMAHGAIPSFFFGVRNGLRLSYRCDSLKPYFEFLANRDIPFYIHGMAYDDISHMRDEYESFKQLSGSYSKGIRNHYLRRSELTIEHMSEIGYTFDSTKYELSEPQRIGRLWEIPISLMDVSMGIDSSLQYKKQYSLRKVKQAQEASVPYFVLNVHDNYIARTYPSMREWYEWFLGQLARDFEFTSFNSAMSELYE